jgi:hypothetical protein
MIRKVSCWACVAGLALATAACAIDLDRPAVVTNASANTRAELQRIVGEIVGDPQIALAEDALVNSSTLIIERAMRRDPNGLLANGRETQRPQQFELILHGSRCMLVRSATGDRWFLRDTKCRAIPGE